MYPIDGTREDVRSGVIAASMAGGKVEDYIISFDVPPNPITEEDRLRAFFNTIIASQQPT